MNKLNKLISQGIIKKAKQTRSLDQILNGLEIGIRIKLQGYSNKVVDEKFQYPKIIGFDKRFHPILREYINLENPSTELIRMKDYDQFKYLTTPKYSKNSVYVPYIFSPKKYYSRINDIISLYHELLEKKVLNLLCRFSNKYKIKDIDKQSQLNINYPINLISFDSNRNREYDYSLIHAVLANGHYLPQLILTEELKLIRIIRSYTNEKIPLYFFRLTSGEYKKFYNKKFSIKNLLKKQIKIIHSKEYLNGNDYGLYFDTTKFLSIKVNNYDCIK